MLVTGGTGLVGTAIGTLNTNFYLAGRKDGDLRSMSECRALFERLRPKYVIHLAANVGGLYKNMAQPVEMINDNILINTNVLECAKEFGVTKLIAVLSTCIFPDGVELTVDSLHCGPPHPSNEGYSYAKRLLETQCRMYNRQYGTNFMCVIPTNLYGPGDNFSLTDSHVVPALIHKAFLAKRNDTPFTVLGSGKPLRQFMYSVDFAKVLLQLVFSEKTDTVIVAPKAEYTIQELALVIARQFGIETIIFDESFSDGQYKKTVQSCVQFEETSLEDGIRETINNRYLLEDPPRLRLHQR
jgi:GDP-L-fucose synthase